MMRRYFQILFTIIFFSSIAHATEVHDSLSVKGADKLGIKKTAKKEPFYKKIAITVHGGFYKDCIKILRWDEPTGKQGIPYGVSLEIIPYRYRKKFSFEFSAFFFPGMHFLSNDRAVINISNEELTSLSFVFKFSPAGEIGNLRPYFHFGFGGGYMLGIDQGCGLNYKLKYGLSLNAEARVIFDFMKALNTADNIWYPIFFTAGLRYQIE